MTASRSGPLDARPIIDEMLRRVGKTYDEAQATDKWCQVWTWTPNEEASFKAWFKDHAKHERPSWTNDRVEEAWSWFNLAYGLRTVPA